MTGQKMHGHHGILITHPKPHWAFGLLSYITKLRLRNLTVQNNHPVKLIHDIRLVQVVAQKS